MITLIDKLKEDLPIITNDFKSFAKTYNDGLISTKDVGKAGGWAKYAKSIGATDKELLKFLGDVDSGSREIDKIDDYMASATTGATKFKTALKSLGANIGIMLAITLAVQLLAKAYDELVVTMEEQQEIVDGLKTDIEGLSAEYDILNKKGNLTDQEKARLEMLERQLELKKELLAIEQKELADKELRQDNQGLLNHKGVDQYSLDITRQSKQLDQVRDRINNGGYSGWVLDDYIQQEQDLMQSLEDNRISMMQELQYYSDRYDKIQANLDAGIYDGNPEEKANWENQLQIAKDKMGELQTLIDNTEFVLGVSVDVNVAKEHIKESVKGVSDEWLNSLSDEELTYLFRLDNIGEYTPEELKEAIDNLHKESKNPIEIKVTTADVITEFDEMSEGFEKLSEIYDDIKDGGNFDFSNISKNSDFGAIFGEVEGFEEFIDIVAKSPNDIKACQSAFDDLVTSWLDSQNPLEHITEENRGLYIQLMKNVGITNAAELADYELAKSKDAAWVATKALKEGTADEIQAFYDEADAAGYTADEIKILEWTLYNVSKATLNFDQQIGELDRLYKKAFGTSMALARVADMEAGKTGWVRPSVIAEQKNAYEAELQAYYDNLESEMQPSANYNGGGGGGKGGGSSSKDPHVAEVDKYKTLTDAVDEYDRKLEKLERIYDNTDSIEERIGLKQAEIKLYQEQKDAIDALNKARDKEISANVDKLRSVGFKIDYDPNTENLIIHNREHINSLSQDIIKTYEDLLKTTDELNDANKDSADQWDELTSSIIKAGKEIKDLEKEKYEDYIEGAEHVLRLMENRKDAFGKESSVYTNMMNTTLQRWKKLVTTDYEGNIEEIRELEEAWMDFYDSRIEREKEILEMQLDDNDKVLDGVIKVIDDEIKAIDNQIDSLSKANDERKKALELQKAQAELDKARNQKTRMVLRKGVGWVYEADEDAIRKAEEDLADKQHESKVDALEEEKEALEELKEKWEEIPDVYENEQNKLLMIERLGADAEEDILAGRTDIYEKFKDDYIDIQEQIKEKTDELEEHTSQAYLDIVQGFEAIAKLAGLDDALTTTTKEQSKTKQSSWYVNKDGTAPSQAKIGDLVYTKGGTYKITAKDENGKFTSEKINNNSANIADNMWGKKFKEEIVDSASDVSYVVKEIVDKSEDIIQQAKNTILSESGLARIIADNTSLTDDEISAIFENVDITEMLSDETDDNTDATDDNTRAILRFIEALQNLELEVPVEEMTLENFDDSIMSESDQAYVKELQRAWNLAMQQGNYELAEQIHAMADEARLRYLDDDPTNDFNKIAEDFAKLADSQYEYSHSVQIGGSNGDPSATQKYLDNLEWLRGKSEGYASQDFMDRLDDVEDAVRNGNGLTQTVYTDQYGRVSSVIDYADKVEEKESGKNTSDSNKDSSSKPKLNDSDSDAIKAAQKAYNEAKAQGDTEGMQKAHETAEAIRNKNGYSGGTDGSQYIVNSNSKVANSNDRNSDAVSDNTDSNYYAGDSSRDSADKVVQAGKDTVQGVKDATSNIDVNVNMSGSGSSSSSSSGSKSSGSQGSVSSVTATNSKGQTVTVWGANKATAEKMGYTNVKENKKAKGGRNLVEDIYNVDEKGRELLIQPTQGRYVHLSAGSDVIPANITDVLWKFGQNPSGFVKDLGVDYNKSIKPVAMSSNKAVNYNISKVEMHGVDDWMGFMNELQHLPMDANQYSYIR